MKNSFGKEIRKKGFKEGYHSLPHNKMRGVRDEICKLCYWSVGTFKIKLAGKVPFRIYEIEMINKCFETHNLNAWTGEPLTKN
jgi:hypothetical protein